MVDAATLCEEDYIGAVLLLSAPSCSKSHLRLLLAKKFQDQPSNRFLHLQSYCLTHSQFE